MHTVRPELVRPIALRGRTLENNLALAPMAGVSNLPFRLIARQAGAALVFTETVSAKGLVMEGRKTKALLRTSPRETPCAFQLFGSEPEILGEACRRLEGEGAVWIDLNVGCPVKKFIRNCAGSALLRDLPRAGAIVRAMRRAFGGTLSVKMRTGWDERSIVAPELARIAAAEGAELVSVHGRTRAQFYSGSADRSAIRAVVEAVPGIPVLANGDIACADGAFAMLAETGAAGVMIGRGAMGNPWIFRQVLVLASRGDAREPSHAERLATIERHIDLMAGCFDDTGLLAANLKKYVAAYSKGLPGSAAFRQLALEAADLDSLLHHTRRFFGGLAEGGLTRMARELRGVLDALLDGLVVLDAELRIELLNTEASRVLGVSSEHATGGLLARAGAGQDFVRIARAVLASGGTQVESELRVPRRFAEDLVVDVAASPLFEENGGGVSGVVIVLRDRTIQKSLQDWVDERERLDAFGEIAAGIAHEVRNPLGGIRGAAEILSARSGDARARDAAALIVREVDRIATLVDDLMIFKQGGELQLAPLNIHRVLDDVLDLLSMDPLGAGVKLTREFDPSIPEILGDADRLVQVFLNLARNALQALDGEGRLMIETRTTLDHRLGSAAGPRLPGVVVTVEDDGPGIPPELRAKVTTPFFTTRRGGTGLGLAVAGHWVARHGGTLRIGDAPGGGTRVRVSLPLRRTDAEGSA